MDVLGRPFLGSLGTTGNPGVQRRTRAPGLSFTTLHARGSRGFPRALLADGRAHEIDIILTSRADSLRARIASCAVAVLAAHARRPPLP